MTDHSLPSPCTGCGTLRNDMHGDHCPALDEAKKAHSVRIQSLVNGYMPQIEDVEDSLGARLLLSALLQLEEEGVTPERFSEIATSMWSGLEAQGAMSPIDGAFALTEFDYRGLGDVLGAMGRVADELKAEREADGVV